MFFHAGFACHSKGERHVLLSFGATSILYIEHGFLYWCKLERTPSCQGSGCRSWTFRRLACRSCQHRGCNFAGTRILCLSRTMENSQQESALRCLHEVWILLKQNLFTKRSKWKDADRGLLCLRRALQSADGHIPSDSHEYHIVVLICFAGDACHVCRCGRCYSFWSFGRWIVCRYSERGKHLFVMTHCCQDCQCKNLRKWPGHSFVRRRCEPGAPWAVSEEKSWRKKQPPYAFRGITCAPEQDPGFVCAACKVPPADFRLALGGSRAAIARYIGNRVPLDAMRALRAVPWLQCRWQDCTCQTYVAG